MKFEWPHNPQCDEMDFNRSRHKNPSVTLNAYLRNIRMISNKIDLLSDEESQNILNSTPQPSEIPDGSMNEFFEMDLNASHEKVSLLSSLEDQAQETLDLLKQEAADNLALHIALEDHLVEQMKQTQKKLQQNINMYLDVIGKLNDLQNSNLKTGGLLQ